MKNLFRKTPPFLRNFYVVAILLFVCWMLFFDSNDLFSQYRLSRKQSELEQTKAFYQEKIQEVKSDREALLNDDDLLEKMAREKYFMKKDNEDVYVIVEEQ
ncbi:MAG: septum formation initiator family protein [Cyclobacteriaceae bacterium]|nr:septum formation initiator family protein [Cyclobacteriaceae bacterium HetDA_MAG_MS6]